MKTSISFVLRDVRIEGDDIPWDGVDGGVMVGLVDFLIIGIALEEALVLSEAYQILTPPALPTEFEQALVEQCLQTDLPLRHPSATADSV